MEMDENKKRKQGKFRPGVIDEMPYARSKLDLLSKIAQLDMNGRKNYGGCITKNKELGEYVRLAETTVSKYIRELRRDGHLVQTAFRGNYRILRISDELYDEITNEKEWNKELANQRKAQDNNARQGDKHSTNGNSSSVQGYGTAPYNNPPPSRTSLETSIPTFVPAIFDETGVEWERFLKYADEVLTKSSRETLHKLKVNSNGKTLSLFSEVSESLLNVITKYFVEKRKLPLIVQIQKIGDSKDQTENLTPEIKMPNVRSDIEHTQSEGKQEIVKNLVGKITKSEPEIQYEYFHNISFRDESIRGFLDYSSLKLNRPELEILRSVRIQYDFKKITFFDPIPEKLKNHIRTYFFYKTKSVIATIFMDNKIHFHSAA
ncbi:hypothetical protein JWG45_17570 [Leptospira sp. 201903070]|uniref:DNA-binding protein n=2 Tax=Leptospira ainlahdjerensis TaxID=2810033 RepID=A0ABS2UF45_9LEPT|nr:hypothetical protein [Leptospira ainlahdjerensis]